MNTFCGATSSRILSAEPITADISTTGGLAPSKEDGTMCTDREAKMKSALQEIAEMKIPYCDADDVAHSMRDIARDALSDKCRGES